jgi:dTDP-4-amino-4,6-dideoxygalactose transaminase
MTLDADAAYHLMTPKTQAIVSVNYAGYHVDTKKLRDMAPKTALISDCAQSLEYNDQDEADYLCFSFQAIKLLTASNGGCLVTRTAMEATIAKRLRWFGIEREAKLRGNWANDIREAGYKAQMTDIEAAIGLGNLMLIDERLAYRRRLLSQYKRELQSCRHTRLAGEDQIGSMHDAWICTIITTEMTRVTQALKAGGIEHGPVHYRNDRYSLFKERARIGSTVGMDSVDGRYLCVPLHCKVTPEDVSRICDIIKSA